MSNKKTKLIPGQVYYLDKMKEDWAIFKEYSKEGHLLFTPLEGSSYIVNEENNTIGFSSILNDKKWEIKED